MGVPVSGFFRVVVFGMKGEEREKQDFKSKISDTNLLSDAIACHFPSVKVYNDLDRNLNLSKTAQDLYVHYKTASYRIEKIAKITGVDFNNANEVLAFRIGLVVYKMIEKYNKDFI